MLKFIYPQIKAADPEAQVLVGGLLLDCDPRNPPEISPGEKKDCTSAKFLEGVLVNGGANFFDGVSYHAYDYYAGSRGQFGNSNWNSAWNTTGPVNLAKAHYLLEMLSTYHVSGKYLLNTEAAIFCDIGCEADYEATKAYYLAEAYTYALVMGERSIIWYDLYGSWRNSGLLYPDGTPWPAYYAFKNARKMLGVATYTRQVDLAADIAAFEFKRFDRRVWVLWAKGNGHPVTLPGTPLAAWDTYGNPLPASTTMSITFAPIYLEWR
jgi:hypothetical protein